MDLLSDEVVFVIESFLTLPSIHVLACLSTRWAERPVPPWLRTDASGKTLDLRLASLPIQVLFGYLTSMPRQIHSSSTAWIAFPLYNPEGLRSRDPGGHAITLRRPFVPATTWPSTDLFYYAIKTHLAVSPSIYYTLDIPPSEFRVTLATWNIVEAILRFVVSCLHRPSTRPLAFVYKTHTLLAAITGRVLSTPPPPPIVSLLKTLALSPLLGWRHTFSSRASLNDFVFDLCATSPLCLKPTLTPATVAANPSAVVTYLRSAFAETMHSTVPKTEFRNDTLYPLVKAAMIPKLLPNALETYDWVFAEVDRGAPLGATVTYHNILCNLFSSDKPPGSLEVLTSRLSVMDSAGSTATIVLPLSTWARSSHPSCYAFVVQFLDFVAASPAHFIKNQKLCLEILGTMEVSGEMADKSLAALTAIDREKTAHDDFVNQAEEEDVDDGSGSEMSFYFEEESE